MGSNVIFTCGLVLQFVGVVVGNLATCIPRSCEVSSIACQEEYPALQFNITQKNKPLKIIVVLTFVLLCTLMQW